MVGELRCSGKEFHVLGAATRKLRLPNSVLVDGTHRSPRCAVRSLTLPPISVSGVQMPQKYEGTSDAVEFKRCSTGSGSVFVQHSLLLTIFVLLDRGVDRDFPRA